MRIVDARYEIMEDMLQSISIPERIELCGRLCYKSEYKITNESAIPFCSKIIKSGHLAVMEMAMIHVVINGLEPIVSNKYIKCQVIEKGKYIISGSIRAFIESDDFSIPIINGFLSQHFPWAFDPEEYGPYYNDESDMVRFAEPHEIPYEHKKIAVKLITNRAVSHEIVRHRPCSFLQESQRYCRYSEGKFGNQITVINPRPFFNPETNPISYKIWKDACEFSEYQYFRLLELGASAQAARTILPNSTKTEIIIYADTVEWEHIFSLRIPRSAEPSMRELTIPLQREMFEKGMIKKMTLWEK